MIESIRKFLNISYRLAYYKSGDWSDGGSDITVLLHGIGVNHHIWKDVIGQLDDRPVLTVDLIGFGASKKPDWISYDLNDHVKSLHKTLRKVARGRRLVLVGHSLGSLVAVRYAYIFPGSVERLVLCSPPIYQGKSLINLSAERIVRGIGKRFLAAIESSKGAAVVANQYKLQQKNFRIDPEYISPYSKTARNSILYQNTYSELLEMNDLPVDIIYGTLDTVMIADNFNRLARRNSNIKVKTVLSGHEIRKRYAKAVASLILSPQDVNQ